MASYINEHRDSQELRQGYAIELLPEIVNRYAVRSFLSQPIPRESILRVLDAGRLAPSAKNRQAWRFVVVEDPVIRGKITEASYGQDCIQLAPAIVALCTTNVDYKMPNGQPSYPVDLGIASAFMMLQASREGLGSCPVSTFAEADVRSILTVPYGMRIVLLLALGYPEGEQPLRDRLPLARLHSFNSW